MRAVQRPYKNGPRAPSQAGGGRRLVACGTTPTRLENEIATDDRGRWLLLVHPGDDGDFAVPPEALAAAPSAVLQADQAVVVRRGLRSAADWISALENAVAACAMRSGPDLTLGPRTRAYLRADATTNVATPGTRLESLIEMAEKALYRKSMVLMVYANLRGVLL